MGLNVRLSMKKAVCIATCAMMIAGLSVPVSFADERQLTRGEAASFILEEARDYNGALTEADILKGYKSGSIEENKKVSRVEAYVMLARAFNDLETPKGNNLRTGVFNVAFEDVPLWADKELKPLRTAGLLTEQSKNVLGARETVSEADLELMLDRIYQYMGSDIKDNFYAGTNKAWLDASVIPQGYSGITSFTELSSENNKHIKEIVADAVEEPGKKGSREQKIAEFYESILDKESRNKQGIEPLKKYFDLIDKAKTMDALMGVDAAMDNEVGISFLFPWGVAPDVADSTKNIVQYYGYSFMMDKESYEKEPPELVAAFKKMVKDYMELTGKSPEQSEKIADAIYKTEKELSQYALNGQEMYSVKKTYNMYDRKSFCKLFKGMNADKAMDEFGLGKATKVNVYDKELTVKTAELFTDENLALWKSIMKFKILCQFQQLLSEDVNQIMTAFKTVYTGTEGDLPEEEKNLNLLSAYFSTPIEQIYAEKYFKESAKKDIERMVQQFIGVYKQRITDNDWLSEATKKMAIKKLDNLTVKVGYPDVWPEDADRAEIVSYKNGGSLFANVAAVSSSINERTKRSIEKDVDKGVWVMRVYEVNAYYNPQGNEIVFPAGILQSPFYSESASEEANLGGIGTVIAHEITHAFDNNGSAYDENGNAKNWWTVSDLNSFNEKCNQVVELYGGKEVAPGILNDGALTVSENVADLGGLSCSLEVASKLKSPNYDELFRSFSNVFRASKTRASLDYYAKVDVHSNGRLRVNQAVKNFEQFYKTYDIKEGDAMYLAPEERIDIW